MNSKDYRSRSAISNGRRNQNQSQNNNFDKLSNQGRSFDLSSSTNNKNNYEIKSYFQF